MDKGMIEFVYDAMLGEFPDTMPPGIVNEFAEGAECSRLYDQVYEAERRLEARLGVKAYDKDVERIICAMSDIQRHLCFKMYAYGARYGYNRDKLYLELRNRNE